MIKEGRVKSSKKSSRKPAQKSTAPVDDTIVGYGEGCMIWSL